MLKLLLDENISPSLIRALWDRGVDTIALRDRGLLNVADHIVWRLAQEEGRAVVTINYGDFRRLASRSGRHAGLVIIPSGRTRDGQLRMVANVIEVVRGQSEAWTGFGGRIFEISDDGQVRIEGPITDNQSSEARRAVDD
jgi:predicted nuclease of predicted toxin-antitoxin system